MLRTHGRGESRVNRVAPHHDVNGPAGPLPDPAEPRRAEAVANEASSPRQGMLRRGIRRVLADPSQAFHVLNAQLRLRRRARVPLSVRLRGRARLDGRGEVLLGDRVNMIGTTVPIELCAWKGGRIAIGEATFINYGVSISAHESVAIGRDCAIGQYVIINDNDYHDIEDKRRLPPPRPVVIEDRVWLGARVIVLKGVRIGHDSVVGAGSVVTADIPPRSIAVGMPARVVREF